MSGFDWKRGLAATPLIDVALLLVVVALLGARMFLSEHELRLPQARKSRASAETALIILTLPNDHSVWLGSVRIEPSALESALVEALRKQPKGKLIIRGQRGARTPEIERVIALARARSPGREVVAVDLADSDEVVR